MRHLNCFPFPPSFSTTLASLEVAASRSGLWVGGEAGRLRTGIAGSSVGNGNGRLAVMPPNNLSNDPNEPRYCACKEMPYGKMIEGTWFCPQCRDHRDLKTK
ncbi:hypothetical protein BC830DRAFT_1146578 [Chytriomyces sp. MP71]|nr:hypothetical protein BC830DRAFT_1146578 [Chytriomyces sp. MP71]